MKKYAVIIRYVMTALAIVYVICVLKIPELNVLMHSPVAWMIFSLYCMIMAVFNFMYSKEGKTIIYNAVKEKEEQVNDILNRLKRKNK